VRWHITRDGQDVYSWKLKAIVKSFGPLARLARFAYLNDQVEACRRVFASDTLWTGLTPLCLSSDEGCVGRCGSGWSWRSYQVVDLSGDVALEAPERLAAGFALGGAAVDVVAGWLVAAQPG
jgi:hypothetical protein